MSLIIALMHMHEADTTWHGSKSDVRFASNLLRCIFYHTNPRKLIIIKLTAKTIFGAETGVLSLNETEKEKSFLLFLELQV